MAVLEASSLQQAVAVAAAVEEADIEVTVIAAADLAAAWQRDPLEPIAAAVAVPAAAVGILLRVERETKPRASLRSGRQELIVVDEAAQAAVVAGVALKTATPLTLENLASEMELLAAASWAAVASRTAVAVAADIAAAEEGADLLTFVSDEVHVVGQQSAPAAAEQVLPRWNKSRIHRTDLMEGRMMPW